MPCCTQCCCLRADMPALSWWKSIQYALCCSANKLFHHCDVRYTGLLSSAAQRQRLQGCVFDSGRMPPCRGGTKAALVSKCSNHSKLLWHRLTTRNSHSSEVGKSRRDRFSSRQATMNNDVAPLQRSNVASDCAAGEHPDGVCMCSLQE
jgi:hypothetical protein